MLLRPLMRPGLERGSLDTTYMKVGGGGNKAGWRTSVVPSEESGRSEGVGLGHRLGSLS